MPILDKGHVASCSKIVTDEDVWCWSIRVWRSRAEDLEMRTQVACNCTLPSCQPLHQGLEKQERHLLIKEFNLVKCTWHRETVIDSPPLACLLSFSIILCSMIVISYCATLCKSWQLMANRGLASHNKHQETSAKQLHFFHLCCNSNQNNGSQ